MAEGYVFGKQSGLGLAEFLLQIWIVLDVRSRVGLTGYIQYLVGRGGGLGIVVLLLMGVRLALRGIWYPGYSF